MKYQIVRFFRDGRPREIIKRNLTLAQAQDHCKDPNTRLAGVWFDGYERQKQDIVTRTSNT